MIPKIIHYCWFGKKAMPVKLQQCLSTWRQNCPDYRIIEWNETNFDVNMFPYAAEAYAEKKYAFVSDVARLYALSEYGGIYLDTDVEVLRPFDGILQHHCVFGFEYRNWIATSFMAAEKDYPLMKNFLSAYRDARFVTGNEKNTETNVEKLTLILCEKGLCRDNTYQQLPDGIVIYPKEYFSPYDYGNCVNEKTKNSICIHYFYVSWLPGYERIKKQMKKMLVSVIGKKNLVALRNWVRNENENE